MAKFYRTLTVLDLAIGWQRHVNDARDVALREIATKPLGAYALAEFFYRLTIT